MTTIGDSAAAGPLSRPEGEQGGGHTGYAGEASPPSLANTTTNSPAAESPVVVTATSPFLRLVLPEDKDARKALVDLLYTTQRDCAHAAAAVLRELQRLDGRALDAFVATHDRRPKLGKEWPAPKGNWYALARSHAPELSPGTAASIARDVERQWRQQRWDAIVFMRRRPLAYRDTYPIPLRAQELQLRAGARRTAVLTYPLRAGKGQRIELTITARDAFQRNIVDKVLSGQYKLLASRLKRDRKGRWGAQLVYQHHVDKQQDGRAVGLNRGVRRFLVAATASGEQWVVDGADIVAVLQQLGRRRRQLQAHARTSSRAGRGRKRILRPLETLQAKGARWRHSRIQTIAARFAQWCLDQSITTVYLEDFTGIRSGELAVDGPKPLRDLIHSWPYLQLEQAIIHRCTTAGLLVHKVASDYISQTCAMCGLVAAEHVDLRRWKMRCSSAACGAILDLDVNAALNVLHRGEGSGGAVVDEPTPNGKPAGRRVGQRTSRKAGGNGAKSRHRRDGGRNGAGK